MLSAKENTSSLLNIVRYVDNFPTYYTPFPTRHPITGKRLIPLYLNLKDFQNKLQPIGIFQSDLIEILFKDGDKNGLSKFSVIKKLNEGDKELIKKKREYKDRKKGKVENQVEDKQQKDESSKDENSKDEKKEKKKVDIKVVILAVYFTDEVNEKGNQARSEVINRILTRWKDDDKFRTPLKWWMDEKKSVYSSPRSSIWKDNQDVVRKPFGNIAFEIERVAEPIFGFTRLGVHMTAYEGEGENLKIWVPKRSAKIISPLKLDSSVAGGLPAGQTPFECLIKEAQEEAGWKEDLVRKYAKHTGSISYMGVEKWGGISPGLMYTYDLPLPSQDSPEYCTPNPNDDEVESFELLTVPEVLSAIRHNSFKPNSAIIAIDFLIRHGYITPENEPNYAEINRRIHRRTGIAGPGL